MEIIFELVFQLLFEIIGDFLIEAGFRGAAAALRTTIGRYVTAVLVGLGSGIGWGLYVASTDHVGLPRSLWVSLALAALAGAAAAYRATASRTSGGGHGPSATLSWPWTWPAHRFGVFAALNGAIAAGIALGFGVAGGGVAG